MSRLPPNPLQDFTQQRYQLDHYEHIIAPTVYPQWYQAYRRLTRYETPSVFYLQGSDWAKSLCGLMLAANKRLVWSLCLPPLAEEDRHHLLYTLQKCQEKKLAVSTYFNKIRHATPYVTQLRATDDLEFDLFEPSSFCLSFLMVDRTVVFERPSLPHHQQHALYLVKNIDKQQEKWLLSLPYLHLSQEDIAYISNTI